MVDRTSATNTQALREGKVKVPLKYLVSGSLINVEARFVLQTFIVYEGNIQHTASALRIGLQTLNRRLRDLGITEPTGKGNAYAGKNLKAFYGGRVKRAEEVLELLERCR